MIWIKRGITSILLLVLLLLIGIYATGHGPTLRLVVDFAFGEPDLPFNPDDAVAAPDYALQENWAALPNRNDLADMVPAGVAVGVQQGNAPVDVFFIHPTGFMRGSSWTFSMDPNTSTEENTKWMMANQASPYNGCCNVYAPRYRQASIYTYISSDESVRPQVLGFAYKDVERAFDYFLDRYSEGRPFIIASHSQGTHHGIRLLQDRISGSALANRMVAAFIIGGGIKKDDFKQIPDIRLCDSPTQLQCAVHWDTFSMDKLGEAEDNGAVCTNPLTWKLDGDLAGKEQHRGAVYNTGEYHVAMSGDDRARGVEFKPLAAPLSHYVEAQCVGGRLYITDQSGNPFGDRGNFGGTYHGLDYPMFYMDIRENAQLRVATYLAQQVDATVQAPTEATNAAASD